MKHKKPLKSPLVAAAAAWIAFALFCAGIGALVAMQTPWDPPDGFEITWDKIFTYAQRGAFVGSLLGVAAAGFAAFIQGAHNDIG